ncbi:MAG: SWIM zinc finger family protein [Myxococcales bacterium]|nr:SWIM zinc finger family protein [Myxococcales bacterium]
MSNPNDTDPKSATEATPPEDQVTDERTSVTLSYGGASQVVSDEGGARLALVANRRRPPVALRGKVRAPLLLREALSCLYDVVSSDFRYVPKDRAAYLAYMRMRKSTQGMGAWQAQQAYYEWMSRNDPLAFLVLDPVVTVHPDALIFEVFSKDEGTYAQLAVDWSALEVEGEATFGTTNIDYSKGLFDGIQRMRSYRETRIEVGSAEVAVATTTEGGEAKAIEKEIKVPDTWLRGFLQVQSAATLPTTVVKIAAIDLYNVLRQLRLHADQKKKGRGIRIELIPGEAPRLVLEPWEEVLTSDAGPYSGRTPAMIRIWGRRRLMLLRRLLPFVESVELHLLGSGLPSFYVLRAGPVRLTLGLSGFTAANWAQAVAFDLLLPRLQSEAAKATLAKILEHLAKVHSADAGAIAKAVDAKKPEVLRALQLGCQHGLLMYDVAGGVYRHRPLLGEAIDPDRLEFRNLRERIAHDLIAAKAVKITHESRIFGVGLEITGEVKVKADRREYRPQLTIDDEGRVRKAECTCTFFRKHKLKEGPCTHLIALRMMQALEEQRRRQERGGARGKVIVETRTYARRQERGEEVVQIALDRQRVKVRWGERGARLRVQSLVFNSVAEARAAFFARVDDLEASGYLDEAAV